MKSDMHEWLACHWNQQLQFFGLNETTTTSQLRNIHKIWFPISAVQCVMGRSEAVPTNIKEISSSSMGAISQKESEIV